MSLQALPDKSDAPLLFIQWAVGGIVYVASLMLVFAFIASQSITDWRHQLQGRATIQLFLAEGGVTPQEKNRILERLRQSNAIITADWLSDEAIKRLLQPWLGSYQDVLTDVVIPAVIDVQLRSGRRLKDDDIKNLLGERVERFFIEDHQRWFRQNFAFLHRIETFAVIMMAVLMAVAALVVFFMVRIGVALHRETIEILTLIGAQDSFIRRRVTRRFVIAAFRGGVVAGVLAALTLVALGFLHEQGVFWFQHASAAEKRLLWGVLLSVPFVFSALVAMIASLTTQRLLTRML